MARKRRYNSDTFQRLNQIGGADLALRYVELSEAAARESEDIEPAEPDPPETTEDLPARQDEPQALGFDGWLNRLQQELPSRTRPQAQTAEPLDDMAKMKWYFELDRRHLFALPRIVPGKTDGSLLQDLREIAAEYSQLRKAGPHRFGVYTDEQLAAKIADVHATAARACECMRDNAQAETEYSAAIEIYTGLGQDEKAQACRTSLARLREKGADMEFKRLHAELAARQPGTVQHARTLVELASLHLRNHDEPEAERLYLQAERVLDSLGGDPSGGKLAESLTQSLLNPQDGPSSIETALQVRGLYRELCLGLARIYQTRRPDLARQYMEKAAQRDSRQQNDDFTAAMLRALKGELGKL